MGVLDGSRSCLIRFVGSESLRFLGSRGSRGPRHFSLSSCETDASCCQILLVVLGRVHNLRLVVTIGGCRRHDAGIGADGSGCGGTQ